MALVLSLARLAPPAVMAEIAIVGVLYIRGALFCRGRGMGALVPAWRVCLFALALGTLLAALGQPLDAGADRLFSVHMVQHELLIMVIAPLLLLSDPLLVVWRGIPLTSRRVLLGWLVRQRWLRRLGRRVHPLTTLRGAWIVFTLVLWGWHLPALYVLALEYQGIHDLEHIMFLVSALAFWRHIIPCRPFRTTASPIVRVLYVFAQAMASNGLGMIFMLMTTPIYHYYAAQRTVSAAMAVHDQHLAGFVMDLPSTLIWGGAMLYLLARWFQLDAAMAAAQTEHVSLSHRVARGSSVCD